jgi:hypothetical protein
LIDLNFADYKNIKQFNCDQCSDSVKQQRKCGHEGFENLTILKQTDEYGLRVPFCPGKATWFESMHKLFDECRVAMTTGLLPKAGAIEDQSALFNDVFPFFVERWQLRQKLRLWSDINDFTAKIFEAIGKMFGSK